MDWAQLFLDYLGLITASHYNNYLFKNRVIFRVFLENYVLQISVRRFYFVWQKVLNSPLVANHKKRNDNNQANIIQTFQTKNASFSF